MWHSRPSGDGPVAVALVQANRSLVLLEDLDAELVAAGLCRQVGGDVQKSGPQPWLSYPGSVASPFT